ncbi:cysteinyl leukotriene receptor 2 [Vombatus ursinus]|uniref:G-protein coupled receptors family 1 profile domain-containing protein n=1 Tax=Vombatus ursinus TaxID=29139 RepID=A0A4X2LYL1_VOMUR|nr:cysteinyl leukotriene receptor 2 [Vombatus ursinus]
MTSHENFQTRSKMPSKPLLSVLPVTTAAMEPNGSFRGTRENCTVDDFKRNFYPAVYLVVFVVGALGNGFSIFILLQPTKKSKSVNVFMLNLAISDLLFVCTLPFRADYYLRGSHWVFGDAACRIMSYSFYVNMYISVYFLTALSVVRFLATVCPFRFLHVTSLKTTWGLCAAIWVFIMAPSALLLSGGTTNNEKRATCLELNSSKITRLRILNHTVMVVGFVLPFFTLAICYVLIIKTLLKVKAPKSGARISHKKALVTVTVSVILFVLCFLPYHVLRTVHLTQWREGKCSERLHKAVIITMALAASNSCLDPLLYYFAGENFKQRLKAVFKRGKKEMHQSYLYMAKQTTHK